MSDNEATPQEPDEKAEAMTGVNVRFPPAMLDLIKRAAIAVGYVSHVEFIRTAAVQRAKAVMADEPAPVEHAR